MEIPSSLWKYFKGEYAYLLVNSRSCNLQTPFICVTYSSTNCNASLFIRSKLIIVSLNSSLSIIALTESIYSFFEIITILL